MTQPQKPQSAGRHDPKTTLALVKWTTTLGAVSLTLAGWGVLARAEAVDAAQSAQAAPAAFAVANVATSTVTQAALATVTVPPTVRPLPATATPATTLAATSALLAQITSTPVATSTSTPAPSATATATALPASTPATTIKLDIVQWVQTNTGDQVAVVRDNQGVLWYVWGTDVPLIEQGLSPQYQPEAVNSVARSRHS